MKILLNILILFVTLLQSLTSQTVKQEPVNLKGLIPNLVVEDVNKSTEFYKSTLGFEVLTTVPETGTLDFAMLKLDNVTIMFQSMKGLVEALPEFKDYKSGGILLLYIDVENLEEVYKRVKAANAEILVDINTTFYGTKEFTIRDCDGYLLIFAEDLKEE